MLAVDALRLEHQVGKRQREQRGTSSRVQSCRTAPRSRRTADGSNSVIDIRPYPVIHGLVPRIHVFSTINTWMAGTSPAMMTD